MLRPEFVRRKLALLADDLGVLGTLSHDTYAELVADPVRLAAAERLVERIVMRAVDINTHVIAAAAPDGLRTARPSYATTFRLAGEMGLLPDALAASLAASAGLRNVIAHDYNDVDHLRLYEALDVCLAEYPRYVSALLEYVDGAEAAGE